MKNIFTIKNGLNTTFAFPATIFLHLLIVYWLTFATRTPISSINRENNALTVSLLSQKEREHAPIQKPASPNAIKSSQSKRKTATVNPDFSEAISVMHDPLPSSHDEASQPDIPSLPTPGTDEIILNAKRNIGIIDRELRKEFPKLPEIAPGSTRSKLEQGIAAAAKARSTQMETFTLSDGTVITKVIGPLGIYCIVSPSVGVTDGIDHMQSGMRIKTVNCPRS